MSSITSKEKPNWKKWDELLIGAWMNDAHMYSAIFQFLYSFGIDVSTAIPRGTKGQWEIVHKMFVEQGVESRCPKKFDHLNLRVRVLFHQFFPKANDLLWEGKMDKALAMLRKYRLTEQDKYLQEAELGKVIKSFSKNKSLLDPETIPGTNAMHIQQGRRLKSDWATVKPSKVRRR